MKRLAASLLVVLALAACGAGQRRTLEPRDVDAALGADPNPFRATRLSWVETGDERYDRFFREAAALQGAIHLGERALAGDGDPGRILPVLEALEGRAEVALATGATLLPGARADFAEDELKAMAIEPALHEAIGQLRHAAAQAPDLIGRLRAARRADGVPQEPGRGGTAAP
ncbi:hypothetical protein [Vulgatibacter sp.]|uniref:hypothetical protein n=1 Tax=Vulgatibacter sp. TaxID=1971226 RepID=UPI0035627439